MAEIVFRVISRTGQRAQGTLSWAAKNLSCLAVSGPWHGGALEAGVYTSPRAKLLDKNEDPYRDVNGNCWMQVIDPDFSTQRTDLGIHPDGGKPGTSGCIGLRETDTRPWYDAFFAVAGSIKVEVIG